MLVLLAGSAISYSFWQRRRHTLLIRYPDASSQHNWQNRHDLSGQLAFHIESGMQPHHAINKNILNNISAPLIYPVRLQRHTVKTPIETTQITNFFDERNSSFHGGCSSGLAIFTSCTGLYIRSLFLSRTKRGTGTE